MATDWRDRLRRSIKAEMALRSFTYKKLSLALDGIGAPESAASIANRVSRGNFCATKLLQYLAAMNVTAFRPVEE